MFSPNRSCGALIHELRLCRLSPGLIQQTRLGQSVQKLNKNQEQHCLKTNIVFQKPEGYLNIKDRQKKGYFLFFLPHFQINFELLLVIRFQV